MAVRASWGYNIAAMGVGPGVGLHPGPLEALPQPALPAAQAAKLRASLSEDCT